jgi:hypothetical protein
MSAYVTFIATVMMPWAWTNKFLHILLWLMSFILHRLILLALMSLMILIFRLIPEELEYPELRESDEYMIISYRFCIVQVDTLQHVVARPAH